jgi:hypothetical protein
VAEPKRLKSSFFAAVGAGLATLLLAPVHPALGQDQLSAAESAAKAGAESVVTSPISMSSCESMGTAWSIRSS